MVWSLIALLAIIALVIAVRNAGRSSDAALIEQQRREAELETEIEQLRERIKVLERIATDANSADALETRRISAEIEKLRDGD